MNPQQMNEEFLNVPCDNKVEEPALQCFSEKNSHIFIFKVDKIVYYYFFRKFIYPRQILPTKHPKCSKGKIGLGFTLSLTSL